VYRPVTGMGPNGRRFHETFHCRLYTVLTLRFVYGLSIVIGKIFNTLKQIVLAL